MENTLVLSRRGSLNQRRIYSSTSYQRHRRGWKNQKQNMDTFKNIVKYAAAIIAFILIMDVLGFLAWVYSGQYPTDEFYLGTITTHALVWMLQIPL